MRVLVACEFSGVVRDAFKARGHDAWSCDLLPTERPGNHVQWDVLNLLDEGWDLLIAHPPCTYLCNSGARHLFSIPWPNGNLPKVHGEVRFALMREGAEFFIAMLQAPIPRIAVENPIPHKWATEIIGRYSQRIQPWEFGHGESKGTCLWLKGLPPLMATRLDPGREGKAWKMPPGPDQAKNRSRTYQGIADAMAQQWG